MAARARHDERPCSDARAVVAAYAGTTRTASTLAPALDALLVSRPGAAVWLLWPANVPCPGGLDRRAVGRIDYPVPDECGVPSERERAATLRRAAQDAVSSIAALEACAALVFTEPGREPYLPAYLCYLAGVPHRAAFSAEFGGRVLSAVFPPPDDEGAARHLELLRVSHSLLEAATARSAKCAL